MAPQLRHPSVLVAVELAVGEALPEELHCRGSSGGTSTPLTATTPFATRETGHACSGAAVKMALHSGAVCSASVASQWLALGHHCIFPFLLFLLETLSGLSWILATAAHE